MASDDLQDYYALGGEQDRLERGAGRLEALRTEELLTRWLPPAPADVLDVGGAAGRYAFPLAARGYRVRLVDPVPLHVEQARRTSSTAAAPLAAADLGDARLLDLPAGCTDVVLLLGPLYHLVERDDRLLALAEARRVLRPGGLLVVAAISRWASTTDGFAAGSMREAAFADAAAATVATGVHRNPERRPGWFTTAYFHRPEELTAEVREAGFATDGPVAVEGVASRATDLDAALDDPGQRARVLDAVRRAEAEPSLLGASSHLLVAGRAPRAAGS